MKRRRIIVFFVILCVISSSFSVCAQSHQTIPDYASRGEVADMLMEAADFYNTNLVRSDIIKGYEDGQLHEDRLVTRAEALVMLSRAFGDIPEPVGHNARVALTADDFTDIPQWAESELEDVFAGGLVAGTAPGIFSPHEYVTTRQMQLFISRTYALFGTNVKDDFYATVNKETLETIEVLPWNASAGTIENLQIEASDNLYKIINKIIGGNHADGTPKQKIADFYRSMTDMDKRNKDGIKPIVPYLEKIDSVNNISELTLLHTYLSEEICLNPFVNFQLTIDFEDSTKYMLYFSPFTPIVSKDIYLQSGTKKDAYMEYLKTLLILGGEDEVTAGENADAYFEFEKKLAEKMLSPEEQGDIEKIYNIYSYNKICSLFPDFDMDAVLKACQLQPDKRIIVTDVALTEEFSALYNQSNLKVLKTAMKIYLLDSLGSVLNEEFLQASEKMQGAIFGTQESHSVEQLAVSQIIEIMPEYLGEVYAQEYFDEASKKDVENMTRDIIRVFKQRIDSLEWMREETKEKAKQKLDFMEIKIGYPDSLESYIDDVEIVSPKRGGTYFENIKKIAKASKQHLGLIQETQTNRGRWTLNPYTVNAVYNPTMNDITLPAAILQSPLYDKDASYEENLGGIGYIIAHEVTHAFDTVGARFDENGNIGNWWSDKDYEAYSLLCDAVTAHFDGCEAIAAIANNGVLTLNENIADLGAIACITQLAAEKSGFDYGKMYTSVAKVWLGTSTREYAEYLSVNDPHSNGKLRVNRVLVNFSEFYETFDINEGDGMYIEPSRRVTVW